jgi:hypothetical protein
MGSGASSPDPCLAGFFALRCQSSHPAMGHAGPRAMQTRNARSALGGPAIGANSAVLRLHPAGETAESSPPSVFPHLDWLSRIFCSFLQQRIARVRFKFIKRMHQIRNDIVHGRIDEVLNPNKPKITVGEVHTFQLMVHHLGALSILNSDLRDLATKLAVGESTPLDSFHFTAEEMNAMRRQKTTRPSW